LNWSAEEELKVRVRNLLKIISSITIIIISRS